MGREDLRIAIVGLGKMGLLHASILSVLPQVQLAAICEKSIFTRRLLKRMFNGVRIVDDAKKLVDLDLDAIYVTTPIPSHFPVARTIYSEKIAPNLFVEKTLARNHEEAEELCKLAKSSGGANMVGYLRRFYVTFRKARDLMLQNDLGRILGFKVYAYSSDFLESKRSSASASRGGVLRDLGCHALDLALWFFGDQQVYAAKLKSSIGSRVEDSFYFAVRNSDGLDGQFNVSWCMESYRLPEVGLSIIGSKGKMEVNDDRVLLDLNGGGSFIWYRHDLKDNVPFWLGLPEYYREDLHFIQSIRDNCSAEPSFYDASKVDELIDQVEKRVGKSE